MLNLDDIENDLLAHLEGEVPWKVFEQGVPDAFTLKKVSGQLEPYIAVQFGDLQERLSGRGLVGVRANDYDLPVYVQIVAADPTTARRIRARNVTEAFLGYSRAWTGEVRKRPGGGMWPITNSNGATEAYLVPCSFAVTIQLADTPSP